MLLLQRSRDKDKNRVRRDIIAVASQIGYEHKKRGELRRLGRELMARGVKSLVGGTKWCSAKGDPVLLEKVLKAIKLDLGTIDQANKETSNMVQPVAQGEPPVLPPSLPQFDPATMDVLKEMAEWWKQGRPGTDEGHGSDSVPKFKEFSKDDSQITSVRIPKVMLAAIRARIRQEGSRSGGTFSRLVMWLLWRYLNEPAEYLEQPGSESR